MSGFLQRLEAGYGSVGALEGEFVYLYTDFRCFTQYLSDFRDRNEFCETVVAPFLKHGQTVVTPAFTYTTEGRFDTLVTPTKLGALNKWMLAHPGARRSEHPLFSYVAIGAKADFLLGIGKSAFGHDSVYERLMRRNAMFVHVGRPVCMGNTALHYVEQCCGATYRLHKAFKTVVYRGQEYVGTDYSAFLRRRDVEGESFTFTFEKAATRLAEVGLIRATGCDRDFTTVCAYAYDATVAFLCDLFYRDPCIFINSSFVQY